MIKASEAPEGMIVIEKEIAGNIPTVGNRGFPCENIPTTETAIRTIGRRKRTGADRGIKTASSTTLAPLMMLHSAIEDKYYKY